MRSAQCGIRFRTLKLSSHLLKTKGNNFINGKNLNLPGIWSEFKAQFNDPSLPRFDGVVSAPHDYEELRYPNSVLAKGMACMVDIKRPSSVGTASCVSVRQYYLYLDEIDELVNTIYKLASMNPKFFFAGRNEPAKQYLTEQYCQDFCFTPCWVKTFFTDTLTMFSDGRVMLWGVHRGGQKIH